MMTSTLETQAANLATRIIHRARQTEDLMWLVQDQTVLRGLTRKDAEGYVASGKLDMRHVVGVYDGNCPREWIEEDVEYALRAMPGEET
jgi:hypothetical protein